MRTRLRRKIPWARLGPVATNVHDQLALFGRSVPWSLAKDLDHDLPMFSLGLLWVRPQLIQLFRPLPGCTLAMSQASIDHIFCYTR